MYSKIQILNKFKTGREKNLQLFFGKSLIKNIKICDIYRFNRNLNKDDYLYKTYPSEQPSYCSLLFETFTIRRSIRQHSPAIIVMIATVFFSEKNSLKSMSLILNTIISIAKTEITIIVFFIIF